MTYETIFIMFLISSVTFIWGIVSLRKSYLLVKGDPQMRQEMKETSTKSKLWTLFSLICAIIIVIWVFSFDFYDPLKFMLGIGSALLTLFIMLRIPKFFIRKNN